MIDLSRYPQRDQSQSVKWEFLFKLPGGHKYFRDSYGFIGVADWSGPNPDLTEDGALYVVREEPIRFTSESASIIVVGANGRTSTIIESAENGIDLAMRLEMKISAQGRKYLVVNP